MGKQTSGTGRAGFTLIELVIATAILAFVVTPIFEGYARVKMNSYAAALRARTLADASSVNAEVSLAVRNSYGIDYAGTKTGTDGQDQLSLWADKQERRKLLIWLERDAASDVSRIMAKYGDAEAVPLHSNLLFVKRLDFDASPDPRSDRARADDQPWVSMTVEARARSPLEQETDDSRLAQYEKSAVALYGRWAVRNYVPSSLKR